MPDPIRRVALIVAPRRPHVISPAFLMNSKVI
jgi:hypothetical protein